MECQGTLRILVVGWWVLGSLECLNHGRLWLCGRVILHYAIQLSDVLSTFQIYHNHIFVKGCHGLLRSNRFHMIFFILKNSTHTLAYSDLAYRDLSDQKSL